MTATASLLMSEQEWLGSGVPGRPSPKGRTPIPAVLLLVVSRRGQSTYIAQDLRGSKAREFRILGAGGAEARLRPAVLEDKAASL